MAHIAELFPPYMFDSPREYIPGCCDGSNTMFGYIILIDGGKVTFVVTESRAKELSGRARWPTYCLANWLGCGPIIAAIIL